MRAASILVARIVGEARVDLDRALVALREQRVVRLGGERFPALGRQLGQRADRARSGRPDRGLDSIQTPRAGLVLLGDARHRDHRVRKPSTQRIEPRARSRFAVEEAQAQLLPAAVTRAPLVHVEHLRRDRRERFARGGGGGTGGELENVALGASRCGLHEPQRLALRRSRLGGHRPRHIGRGGRRRAGPAGRRAERARRNDRSRRARGRSRRRGHSGRRRRRGVRRGCIRNPVARLQRGIRLRDLDAHDIAHRALAHREAHGATRIERDPRDALLDGRIEHDPLHASEIAGRRLEQLAAQAGADLRGAVGLEREANLHVAARVRRMAEIPDGASEHDLRARDAALLHEAHVLDRARRGGVRAVDHAERAEQRERREPSELSSCARHRLNVVVLWHVLHSAVVATWPANLPIAITPLWQLEQTPSTCV